MTAHVEDRVIDLGLNVLDTESTHSELCSAEPATYTAASSTNNCGTKNWGAGNVFGSPAAATNARKVDSVAVTDGVVGTTTTATNYAITDRTNSRLHAVGSLAASQAVTSGNAYTLPSFAITIPKQ